MFCRYSIHSGRELEDCGGRVVFKLGIVCASVLVTLSMHSVIKDCILCLKRAPSQSNQTAMRQVAEK